MNDLSVTLRKISTGETKMFADVQLYPVFVTDWLQDEPYEITAYNLPFEISVPINLPALHSAIVTVSESGLMGLAHSELTTLLKSWYGSYQQIATEQIDEYELFRADTDVQFAELFYDWLDDEESFWSLYLDNTWNYRVNGEWNWQLIAPTLRRRLGTRLLKYDGYYLYEI